MGVIYKLSEDVVSFIIVHKKNNPSVGVRQLAAFTSNKFQIKVSKSSVSSVLKKASLNSSVGRKSGSIIRPEKFFIPSAKKNEISKNMNKAGFIKKEPAKSFKKENKSVLSEGKDEKTREENAFVLDEPIKEEIQTGSSEISTVENRHDQDISNDADRLRDEKKRQGVSVRDGMGFIFLKAAQWEIARKALMGELFKKHIKVPISEHFEAVSDMFLFFKFLKVETFDHILAYRGHGLWILNNFCKSASDENKDLLELRELFQWEKSLQGPSLPAHLVAEYSCAKEKSFLEVSGFKLLLEDKTELIMDAMLSSFWVKGKAPVAAYGSLPMDKAMTLLSNSLISKIRGAVFYSVPGGERFDQAFYDMIAVFENIPGKRIQKVSVFNEKSEEIAGFSIIPSLKRTFLIGIKPRQKEFVELTKSVKWAGKRSFYHRETNQGVYFTETKTDFVARQIQENIKELKVITVWRDKENEPCWAILTNEEEKAENILETYISRWPYFGKHVQEDVILPGDDNAQKNVLMEKKLNDFSDIFTDFVGALHGYCQKHFFPQTYSKIDITQLIVNIYGISGVFYEEENCITVFLDVDSASAYRKDIEYAAKCVNERCIFDRFGRRLWLEI